MFTVTLCMSSIDLDNARETREFKPPNPVVKIKSLCPMPKKKRKENLQCVYV